MITTARLIEIERGTHGMDRSLNSEAESPLPLSSAMYRSTDLYEFSDNQSSGAR